MADVGGAVLEDINQKEEQDKESEISAQENNAPYGDGGPDDGSDGDDEDTSDSNEDYSVSFP